MRMVTVLIGALVLWMQTAAAQTTLEHAAQTVVEHAAQTAVEHAAQTAVEHAAQTAVEHAAQLVLDAGGHTAAVNRVCFLDDQQLVSVSNDKTIRFWHLPSGECRDVLRPPIGRGLSGALYAVAVSPDRQWLAAGGYEFPGEDHGIYLIRLRDRRVQAVLRGHTNVILDVRFSATGQLLGSASGDRTARVWRIPDGQPVAVLRGHREGVYGLAFSPSAEQLATVSLDGSARTWSLPSGQPLRVLEGSDQALQSIDWSPDGQFLAAGGVDQSIRIWSPQGTLLRHYKGLGNHVTSVRFTPDSQRLFGTLGGGGPQDGGFLLDLATNRRVHTLTGHANSVLDGALSGAASQAATADANGEIRIWDLETGRMLRRLASRSNRPWSAGWCVGDRRIAWGTTSDARSLNERGPLEYTFDLATLDFSSWPAPDVLEPGANLPLRDSAFPAADTTRRSERPRRAVTHSGRSSLERGDAATLIVNHAGGSPTRLAPLEAFDQVRCYSFLDERTVAVGSDFGLLLFDARSGHRLRALRGHMGTVWAVAPSFDGRYLLSAGDDHTLRIWDWRKGQLLLSLFAADRQWIVWTPNGYYAASAGGEQLMGWQLDQGREQLGRFFPAAQFRRSLNRPQLIQCLLDAGSWERALAQVTTAGTADRAVEGIQQVLPPEVAITQPAATPHRTTSSQLTVQATARPRGQDPVTALRLLLDGRPYAGSKGLYVVPRGSPAEGPPVAPGPPVSPGPIMFQWEVTLTPGNHRLAVQAETAVSRAVSPEVEVVYAESGTDPAVRLPDLYILAVGIAEYAGPLQLAYADQDARQIALTLQQHAGSLFRNVHVKLLTNQQATRRDILQGLSWLRREMTQSDVCVVFYSGHGAKDETSMFYLLPVDGEPRDLLTTSVSGSQFKDALAAVPGRILVLLDACHAGAAGGDRRKGVAVEPDDLVRDLVTDDYGVIVMCSSMGREYSLESEDHRQGFFTVALIEALKGQADYNRDGLVYLTEVDTYLADRVKELTAGRQHPVTSKPTTIRSFPLTRAG